MHATRRAFRIAAVALMLLVLITPSFAGAARPYMKEYRGTGYFDCGFTAAGVLRTDLCSTVILIGTGSEEGLDDTPRALFEVPFGTRLTSVVVLVEVDDSYGVTTSDLQYSVKWYNPPVVFDTVTGRSGMQATWHFTGAEPWNQEPREAIMSVEPAIDPVQAAAGLRVDVFIGLFYRDEPIPDGYVPAAERL